MKKLKILILEDENKLAKEQIIKTVTTWRNW